VSDPCSDLKVVEVVVGVSELGLGLAGAAPGMLLAELGAEVTRVVGGAPIGIDSGLQWGRVWNRSKRAVRADSADEIRALIADADVVLLYGSGELVEGRGLGAESLRAANPRLVVVRCRPSDVNGAEVEDYALLSEARSGFCSQLAGHRDGPILIDLNASAIGATALMLTSVFALLRDRELTGAGGSAETSLYDGMLATLGCMIGRSERAAPEIEYYWEHGSTFPNFMYRCADGELIQVWFGGKGMYASLIAVLGDEPSTEGYYADQMAGRLGDRAARWVEFFRTQSRAHWIEKLRAAGVACEPVFAPAQAFSEPHLAEIGLAVQDGPDTVMGSPITINPVPGDRVGGAVAVSRSQGAGLDGLDRRGGSLAGLRVVDFAAFVAGPLAAQALADLGAEVIKVEPPEGEAMRAAAYAIAACQRGKRSLAIDLGAPEAKPVIEKLLSTADVVLHNFRVGVSERLGIDEATVARLNPGAVYCHATGFGTHGPRAKFPGNDALMQAVTGLENAIGGEGNEPIAGTWIPIDMAGGWVAAAAIMAGLFARAATGEGQQVATSLLGAGMLLHSGSFLLDGEVVRGPALDAEQTGYGPGYRLYRAQDGEWFALVLPNADAWAKASETAGIESATYAPLRGGEDDADARAAEQRFAAAFATASAQGWLERLRAAGIPVEAAPTLTRDQFRRGILDDPANKARGRVVEYETYDWGHFVQLGPLLRAALDSPTGPELELPAVGEHSVDVLTELGFSVEQIDALLDAKVVRQLQR
jgi:crotonobetainyl-CoA:carnitine CoA-transferase CaiB-like acyl-CoA transferase